MRNAMRSSLLLFISAIVSLLPSTLCAPLTDPRSSFLLSIATNTSTPSNAGGRDIHCFDLGTPQAFSVDIDDCEPAIDMLFHDPTGVMEIQQFSRKVEHGAHHVPTDWHFGRCQVLLTSGDSSAVDTFRLADVIYKARKLIDNCVAVSKTRLGGIATIGHGATFFVAVNGLGPDLAANFTWTLRLNSNATDPSIALDPNFTSR
ncbi:hypothetical protein MMC28_010640 [Mycoblastus sanguinarius]|nr:hypothetical protein [Mycoblastus sanguinarius]